jgi:chemotaxis protein methyltransferase CheR
MLVNFILPELYGSKQLGKKCPLNVLSAASSTGEEAYSIAITIEEFKRMNNIHDFNYNIMGTDVSLRAIQKAACAVFPESRISKIPSDILFRYFMKSKIRSDRLVKIVPEVRKNVNFYRANLIDDEYLSNKRFHIIFCCNVLIYFNRDNQKKTCDNLLNLLNNSGYFIIGKSETLLDLGLRLKNLKPSVYSKG